MVDTSKEVLREVLLRRLEAHIEFNLKTDDPGKNRNAFIAKDALSAIEDLCAELDEMTAYALEATKVLTGLTPSGSEFFGPELGGIYTANLELCESVIREGRQLAHERWLKATAELDEARAEIERLRGVLGKDEVRIDRLVENLGNGSLPMATETWVAGWKFEIQDALKALTEEPTND